jgi:protein tyrosine phosphatase (PTP) superfamily phosphohydrolase (DUF442 family)
MPIWAVKGQLARSSRPGYGGERGQPVPQLVVDSWVAGVQEFGIKSIICLLAGEHLKLYRALPGGLISYYEGCGFAVAHLPARDYQSPPLTRKQLRAVFSAYQELAKPVLVHCSAGIDRTGMAVEHILSQLGGAA